MEFFFKYFIMFLNLIEESRKSIYEATAQWADKRDMVFSYMTKLEAHFKNYHPFTIAIGFLFLFFAVRWVLKKITNIYRRLNSIEKIKIFFFRLAMNLKFVRDKVQKTRIDIREKARVAMKESNFKKLEFKDKGLDVRTIMNKLVAMNEQDKASVDGPHTKITGTIYINSSELEGIVGETVRLYGYSNLLHPDLFCSARFIEASLVKLGIELFNGDKENACGITTSGGSESILFACLAYRNRGYKMGIKKPEIIVPNTIHAAFFKAGEAFNIKIVKIPVDKNFQVDTRKVAKAINSNTVAIVGSCPNFPHGNFDDIEALSAIGVKYSIPVHVDACLGGLLICFYQFTGIKFPKFDFRLPGVTSISADFHKYGLCPKGSSLLMYKDRDYRKHQYFIYPHFMGGLYPSPGFEGSRTPAFAVASYAILMHIGRNRYIAQAKQIHEAVNKVKTHIKENYEGLEVIGDPQICSVAVKGSKALAVHDAMSTKGWHLNMINSPMGFSFVITSANIENINNGSFFKDLADCYTNISENKEVKISERTKLYGMTLDLPEELVRENMDVICDSMLD